MSWDWLWQRLEDRFMWLSREVEKVNQHALFHSGRTKTEIFPFGAFLTFSKEGVPGEEDLVVSVDVKRGEKSSDIACDISTGDGVILAEGPSATLETKNSEANSRILESWFIQFEEFLQFNREEILNLLEADG